MRDWCVCVFGKAEVDVVSAAMTAGGHARVGFENNLWLRDGSLATGTSALVDQIKTDIMTAPEVRTLWGTEVNG